MSEPRLGKAYLKPVSGPPCAGAAFELQRAAVESESVVVNGWQVQVVKDSRIVVARGGNENGYDEAFRAGLLRAQQGLDLMAMGGANNLLITKFEEDHVIWWAEAGGLVVRVVSLAPVSIDVPPVTLVVKDASGNVVPPISSKRVVWHESFRYFRLSQATDDLFDAYRNAYLALESILSSITPQRTNSAGRVTEGEGGWFKRALGEAGRLIPLASHVPAGTVDPVQHLFDELYREMRSAMSHAKSGRKVLLPQDETERQAITASLRRLIGLYLKLAEAHLGARRAGGGMFAIAFRMGFAPVLDTMKVSASDDESPLDRSQTVPNPAGGEMRELNPVAAAESPMPFVVTRLWSVPSSTLADLPHIRRIVGTRDQALAMSVVLEERLILGSALRLEVLLGVRGSNTRQPRDRYSF
jgi:hypothetical protein